MNSDCPSCLPLFASAAAWKHTSNTHLTVECQCHTNFHEQVKSLNRARVPSQYVQICPGVVCAGGKPDAHAGLLCQQLDGRKVGSTETRMGLLLWHGQPPYQKRLRLPPECGGRCPCEHGPHRSWSELMSAAIGMRVWYYASLQHLMHLITPLAPWHAQEQHRANQLCYSPALAPP